MLGSITLGLLAYVVSNKIYTRVSGLGHQPGDRPFTDEPGYIPTRELYGTRGWEFRQRAYNRYMYHYMKVLYQRIRLLLSLMASLVVVYMFRVDAVVAIGLTFIAVIAIHFALPTPDYYNNPPEWWKVDPLGDHEHPRGIYESW